MRFLLPLSYMCRDPRLWEDPDIYKPERWLISHNPNAHSLPSVYDIIFGFGRRLGSVPETTLTIR
jgi:cytochrome P450